MSYQDLRRTPTSTGNQKVFTYSCWIKRNGLSAWARLLSIMDGNTDAIIQLTNVDKLRFRDEVTGPDIDYISSRPLRDAGGWMHVLVAIDTTAIQAEHRIRMYINGDSLIEHGLDTESMPGDRNLDLQFNDSGLEHRFFARNNDSEYFLGEAFDLFWVDGQALTPDVFGFNKDGDGYISVGSTQATDFRPGQWVPKAPRTIKSEINRRGGFGINGFYLPMNDSSNFGADFHTTPNSIITLKGEDLPQPRNGAPTTSDAYVSQLRSDPYAANLVLAVPGISTSTSANLVTNGTFDTNTTGWTAGNSATLSVDSSRLKVTNGTSSAGYAYQAITVEVGKRYTVNLEGITGTSATNIRIGTSANSADYGNKIGSGLVTISLTATSTTLYVTLKPNSNTNGNNAFFDNIVVKQEDAPKDYSADIKGSGTNKTPTLSGKSGVGYELGGYYGSAYTSHSNDDSLEFPGTSGDFNVGTGDFTIEMWLNPDSTQASNARLFGQDGNSAGNWDVYIQSTSASNQINMMGGAVSLTGGSGSANGNLVGDQWNHFCLERYDGQLTTYVNGVAVYTQSYTSSIGDNNPFRIGQIGSNVYGGITYGFNGEIQDFRFYKGVSKYKGGFDVTKPYTPVGFEGESWRQVPDTCKNNFCTMDPLHSSYAVKRNTGAYVASILNFTEGNLNVRNSGNAGLGPQMAGFSSFGMDSGKWYWELSNWENPANERYGISLGREQVFAQTGNGAAIECMIQVRGSNGEISSGGNHNGSDYEYLVSGTIDNTNATAITSSSDVVGLAFDRDNMAFYVYTNGTLTASITNITTSKTKVSTWFATKGNNSSSTSSGQTYNFGQNPTFGGTITAGTYTDSNGKGLFKYQPPAGYLALCEDNLPTPAITDPGDHFKTVLYTGDGNEGHSITGVGFKPDLVWIKCRSHADNHTLSDTVRGPGLALYSDLTNAEHASTIRIKSFNDDGFTTGSSGDTNTSGRTFCAWCWKAGGAAVANTDGSINSQVSANQTAGFSIVSYTGNGTSGTVGHGLGKTPNIVLVKNRIDSGNWSFNGNIGGLVYGTNKLVLQGSGAIVSDTNEVTSANATTFTLGNSGATNGSSDAMIAYCWTEIEGYSKFSSYQGTGQADGPFVYCGFKPAWVMAKNADDTGGRNWGIHDSSRQPINPCDKHLKADSNEVENSGLGDSTFQIDLLSNGFKVRNNTGIWNNSTENIIFMAFAESPFQTANAK